MRSTIHFATTAAEIDRCFPVMSQLRPMLIVEEFVDRIQTQQAEGYQLAFLEYDDAIVAVAGFRLQTLLWSGRTLYVDDLVTDAAQRSQGHGGTMMTWLIALAARPAVRLSCSTRELIATRPMPSTSATASESPTFTSSSLCRSRPSVCTLADGLMCRCVKVRLCRPEHPPRSPPRLPSRP
jgi:hypothetical protein